MLADRRSPEPETGHPLRHLALLAGLFLLGASAPLRQLASPAVGGVTVALMVAVATAFVGWGAAPLHDTIRSYMTWAVPFGVLVVIGWVAAWRVESLSAAGFVVLWLAVLVPGLANLCRDRAYRTALLRGFAAGTGVFMVVALSRLLSGRPALDVVGGAVVPQFLDINRNAVDLVVLVCLPLLLAPRILGLPRWARVVGILLGLNWLLTSGGRTALVGLLLVPCLLYAFAPRGLRPAARFAAAVGVLFLVGVLAVGAVASQLPASDRLAQLQGGDISASDEIRVLLLRKAWAFGWDSPVVGIGIGNFEGRYHPLVEQATRIDIRDGAISKPAHNTYLEVFAAMGFPGVVAFFGMLAVPLLAFRRRRRVADSMYFLSSYFLLLFGIAFHSSLGTFLYLPLAALLGGACASAEPTES
jgi:hypothetical protein